MSECYHILDDDKRFPGLEEKLGTSLHISRTFKDALAFTSAVPRIDILFLDGYLDSRMKGTDYLTRLNLSGKLDRVDTIALISNSRLMNLEMVKLLKQMEPTWVPVHSKHPVIRMVEETLHDTIHYTLRRKEVIANGSEI